MNAEQEMVKLRAALEEYKAAIRHIDGIANFKAVTGRDREAWEQVQAHIKALSKVQL